VITRAYVLDFINLGNDAMDADDFATAEKYFRIAAAKGNADAHLALGNLLTQQGRGAEEAFLIGVAAGDAHAQDNLDELRASPTGADKPEG